MTGETALIDRRAVERIWDARIGDEDWAVAARVVPNANVEPPRDLALTLRPPPDGVELDAWVWVAADQVLGPFACSVEWLHVLPTIDWHA